MQGAEPRPCRQCKTCRINRKRVWTNRIVMEAKEYGLASCMLTLTYDMLHLPDFDGTPLNTVEWSDKRRQGGLCRRDLVLFKKLFRWYLYPTKIRTFEVGEYGGRDMRPHYHMLVFGVGNTPDIHAAATLAWHRGSVDMGYSSVTEDAAQYCAGYVLKGGSEGDERLVGLPPPFTTMSQGVGRSALPGLIEALEAPHVWEKWAADGDVPTTIKRNGKSYPLGQYLTDKLRRHFGLEKEDLQNTPRRQEQRKQMLAVWQSIAATAGNKKSLRSELVEQNKGKRALVVARSKFFARKEKL